MTTMDIEKPIDQQPDEPYITIQTFHEQDESGLLHKRHAYKIYPGAIKDAVMRFMEERRYIDSNKNITEYHIELDRNEDMMVAVIEQE